MTPIFPILIPYLPTYPLPIHTTPHSREEMHRGEANLRRTAVTFAALGGASNPVFWRGRLNILITTAAPRASALGDS